MAKPATKYDACCSVCYSCVIAKGVSKTAAEKACTGHSGAYGHHTFIIEARNAQ